MSLDPREQPITPAVEKIAGPGDSRHEPVTLGTEGSPYLTAKEAAIWLRFGSTRALYKALKVDGIPCRRRGNKTLLFHRGDLDRWLAGASASDLRREARQRGQQNVSGLHATKDRRSA